MEDAEYGGESSGKPRFFNGLLPPYFSRAVRNFGEYGAKRDENRADVHSGSQELHAKKPANTGDSWRPEIAERDLPLG